MHNLDNPTPEVPPRTLHDLVKEHGVVALKRADLSGLMFFGGPAPATRLGNVEVRPLMSADDAPYSEPPEDPDEESTDPGDQWRPLGDKAGGDEDEDDTPPEAA